MGANHSLLSCGTTVKRRIAAIAAGIATAAMALGGVVAPPATAYADTNSQPRTSAVSRTRTAVTSWCTIARGVM